MIFNPTVQGGKQEAPVISVSSSGLITATAGDQSTTQQLPTQAGRTITPGTSAQTAVASGRYTTGNVTVAGSANLVPANIKSGVNIFGVKGTFEGESKVYTITNEAGGIYLPPSSATAGQIVTFKASNTDFSLISNSGVSIPFSSAGSFINKTITFVMPAENVTLTT